MRIYSHINYILKGYNGLTHEAVTFEKDKAIFVEDKVGERMLGSHPYEFCRLEPNAKVEQHSCRLGTHPAYKDRAVKRPMRHRQMRAQKAEA